MDSAFKTLIHSLATAPTELALRNRFMDGISQVFPAEKYGIYLASKHNLLSCDTHGVSDDFISRYQKYGRAIDPVRDYVVKHHAPCHEGLVFPPQMWQQSELYERCCSQYKHQHIMTGGIVGKGELIGTVHFARTNDIAFNTHDLLKLSAVCNHLSACLANLRNKPNLLNETLTNLLTSREMQIARLVATGLTNAEIAQELWISPNTVKKALKTVFHKLDVGSRAEMVMKLRYLL